MSTHDYDYPPPWTVDDNREGHEGMLAVFDANGRPVVYVADMEEAGGGDLRNADLFAAAPDLLTACEAAMKRFGCNDYCKANGRECVCRQVHAAIAKAKGGRV